MSAPTSPRPRDNQVAEHEEHAGAIDTDEVTTKPRRVEEKSHSRIEILLAAAAFGSIEIARNFAEDEVEEADAP